MKRFTVGLRTLRGLAQKPSITARPESPGPAARLLAPGRQQRLALAQGQRFDENLEQGPRF
jgi:hypothetical protein